MTTACRCFTLESCGSFPEYAAHPDNSASVLETTSFLSGHEWQEASSFRSEILSRGHLFTSYFSFLVIVDTWDVLQPAFRTYSSPYMSRVYCRAVSPWHPSENPINAMASERVKVSPAYCPFPALCAGILSILWWAPHFEIPWFIRLLLENVP